MNILCTDHQIDLIARDMLYIFIPPAVEHTQPPINIRSIKTWFDSGVQRFMSVDEKPVDVRTDVDWNSACLIIIIVSWP